MMSGTVVKSHFGLCRSHRVSERSTAGHKHDAAGARGKGLYPMAQMHRAGETAAKLDDNRAVAAAHSRSDFGTSIRCCSGIKVVHLGDLAGSAARDLRAGPDFELLDANRHGCDPRMSQDDGCDPFGERFGQRYM